MYEGCLSVLGSQILEMADIVDCNPLSLIVVNCNAGIKWRVYWGKFGRYTAYHNTPEAALAEFRTWKNDNKIT